MLKGLRWLLGSVPSEPVPDEGTGSDEERLEDIILEVRDERRVSIILKLKTFFIFFIFFSD
jgi:hypothetical protein